MGISPSKILYTKHLATPQLPEVKGIASEVPLSNITARTFDSSCRFLVENWMWSLENFESSPQIKISPLNRQNLVFSLQKKTNFLKMRVQQKKINKLFTKILKNYRYHFLGKM